MLQDYLVIVKGAGDIATGVLHRLFRSGFPVLATEIESPTAIRRTVAFSEAVYDGAATVEGVTARLARGTREALEVMKGGAIPIVVDPKAEIVRELKPFGLVDAILAKRNLGTRRGDARVVIALGPGFTAGEDVDAVIETQRGHHLARVILKGQAAPDTGIPGDIAGHTEERVLRAPAGGVFRHIRQIGDEVTSGETVAEVDGLPVKTEIRGVLRGLFREGLRVTKGFKVGDVDPRCQREHCFTISDKSRAIGGGVLEALLLFLPGGARRGEVL